MPIVLYKKNENYDDLVDVERDVSFQEKELVETSPKSEIEQVKKKIKEIRKAAGLNVRTGESDDKATPCFPPPESPDDSPIGYIETRIDKIKITTFLKDLDIDLEKVFDIEQGKTWQFISWNVIKNNVQEAIEKINKHYTTEGKYEVLTFTFSYKDYISKDTTNRDISTVIETDDDDYGPIFKEGKEVYGVFRGSGDRIYVAVLNTKIIKIIEIFDSIKNMVDHVLSQKYPYDYILRWEL